MLDLPNLTKPATKSMCFVFEELGANVNGGRREDCIVRFTFHNTESWYLTVRKYAQKLLIPEARKQSTYCDE